MTCLEQIGYARVSYSSGVAGILVYSCTHTDVGIIWGTFLRLVGADCILLLTSMDLVRVTSVLDLLLRRLFLSGCSGDSSRCVLEDGVISVSISSRKERRFELRLFYKK